MLVVRLSDQCNECNEGQSGPQPPLNSPVPLSLLCILTALLDPEPNGDIVGNIIDAVIPHGPQVPKGKKESRPRASRRKPVPWKRVCDVDCGEG